MIYIDLKKLRVLFYNLVISLKLEIASDGKMFLAITARMTQHLRIQLQQSLQQLWVIATHIKVAKK